MPTPKRKKSRASTRSQQSQWKLSPPGRATCPHCHAPKMPHRVCGKCGYYDGREVVEIQ